MESSKTEEEKLQLFFDGELPPEEEEAIREVLQRSPEGGAEIASWQMIRDGMQEAAMGWNADLDSDALFACIEAEIGAPTEAPAPARPSSPELRVVPGGRERRVWGGVAAGLAAAAAIFLGVMAWPGDSSHPSARGSQVIRVDFGEYAGTVFEIEGSSGQPLTVVWISDEEVAIP